MHSLLITSRGAYTSTVLLGAWFLTGCTTNFDVKHVDIISLSDECTIRPSLALAELPREDEYKKSGVIVNSRLDLLEAALLDTDKFSSVSQTDLNADIRIDVNSKSFNSELFTFMGQLSLGTLTIIPAVGEVKYTVITKVTKGDEYFNTEYSGTSTQAIWLPLIVAVPFSSQPSDFIESVSQTAFSLTINKILEKKDWFCP